MTAIAIPNKEEVRRERGKLAASIINLEEARHRLESLMQSMLLETHKGRGKDD